MNLSLAWLLWEQGRPSRKGKSNISKNHKEANKVTYFSVSSDAVELFS